MTEKDLGNTALGAATCRLIEQYQPPEKRLFTDPICKDVVPSAIRLAMQFSGMRNFTIQRTETVAKGIYGSQICRTKYIDAAAEKAIASGIHQLVILGSGLDTRPYRLPGINSLSIFELDLALVQNAKKDSLRKKYGMLPAHVRYIPINFNNQTLEEALRTSDLDASQPVVFIWEAVTQYIPESAVNLTLSAIGKFAPGSILIFTYVLKSIIEGHSAVTGAAEMMATFKGKTPWMFGLDPKSLQAYLAPFHLQLLEDVGTSFYQEKYLQPIGRKMDVSEAERTAVAQVIGL